MPTFAESGLPDYAVTSWYGLALPAGTPAPIVEAFNAALAKTLASDKVRDQIIKIGALPKTSTPEELRRHVAAEIVRWQEVRDKAGIEPQQQ